MNKAIYIIVTGLVISACANHKKTNRMESRTTENERIYVTAFYYIKENGHKNFETYKSKVRAVFQKNKGSLDKMIKPIKVAKGNMALPDEIHFGSFENETYFQATGKDTNYLDLVESYRTPALDSMIVIISRDAHSTVLQEVGDNSKFYAITLLTYKEGENHKENFEEYLSKSCAIMPEFGAHFEKFLIPTMVKGNLEMPNKVHLFYFDSMEGVQKLATDPRMLELYPIRDQALSSATLILGQAL